MGGESVLLDAGRRELSIQHETALVVGASGGIGRAVTGVLAQAGVRVALVGRSRERLDEVRATLGATGERAIIAPCDVSDRAQVPKMVEGVLGEMGSIDILVCASGSNVPKRSFRTLDPDDWDKVMASNLTAAFNAIYFVLPSMRARGKGLVIQIGSLAGLRANVLAGAAYSASKFGQGALGVVLGREERGRGIRSTVICAGEVNTGLLDARGARPGGEAPSRREGILEPTDIAEAVLFLAELPLRAHVPELVIKPTIDDFA
jgi:NADP-dependent 3-hydroxy acid dehydrogenase YdfG